MDDNARTKSCLCEDQNDLLAKACELEEINTSLVKENEFTKVILDSQVDTFFVFELATGRVIRWNKSFVNVSGYSNEEIAVLKAPDSYYSTDDLKNATSTIEAVLRDGKARIELSLICKDGHLVPTEYEVSVLTDDQDVPIYCVSIGRDITERKKAEEELWEYQQMIGAIVESSQDWIWVMDLTGHHTYSNKALENILGYSAVEFQGMVMDMMHPEDRKVVDAQWPDWVAARQGWKNQVLRWRANDGKYRYLESTAVPILDLQGELLGYRGVDRDITDRKRAEGALQQSHDELEQRVVERTATLRKLAVQLCHAEETERKRIAHMLHEDLQQIIVGTRLMLSTLNKKNVASKVRKHTLERAEDQLSQAQQIMHSLAIDLYPPVLSTDGLCAAIPWLAGVMEKRFGMSISVDVDRTAEPTTDSLRVFIFQAVRELLFNVGKHCDTKRAQVRLKQEHGGWILVEVKDSGAGFDAEQIDTRNRFGLFSIRERVDYYGGQMKIQSALGKGTRITLQLPCN